MTHGLKLFVVIAAILSKAAVIKNFWNYGRTQNLLKRSLRCSSSNMPGHCGNGVFPSRPVLFIWPTLPDLLAPWLCYPALNMPMQPPLWLPLTQAAEPHDKNLSGLIPSSRY